MDKIQLFGLVVGIGAGGAKGCDRCDHKTRRRESDEVIVAHRSLGDF